MDEVDNIVVDSNGSNPNEGRSQTSDVFNAESFSTIEGFDASDDVQGLFAAQGINGLNDAGDFINAEGDIVIAKDAYDIADFNSLDGAAFTEKYFTAAAPETEIAIDGNTYQLNETGDAVDDKGDVFMTSDAIKALEVVDDNPFSIEAVAALDGYELVDDADAPIVFEDTTEGIVARQQMIIERESVALANDYVSKFYGDNPDIQEMVSYKEIHGTFKGFDAHTNYSKVAITDKTDESSLEQLVIDAEMDRGRSVEDARRLVKYSKADNQLTTDAKAALEYLTGKQVTAASEAKIVADNNAKHAQDTANKYWGEVKSLIDNGTLLDYKLPENFRIAGDDGAVTTVPRAAFYDYISVPVSNGMTQEQLDSQKHNANTENIIFDALMRFLGGSKEQLITAAANTKNVRNLTTSKRVATRSSRITRVTGSGKTAIDNIN